MQDTLANRFAADLSARPTRSSALFPARVGADSDTVLVFMDYWRLKNANPDVRCTLTIWDQDGNRQLEREWQVREGQTELSLAKIVGAKAFEGMAEIGFTSPGELRVAFPAVIAFYRSGTYFSAVHSPGRVRNAEEARNPARSRETNWTCRFERGVSPFFHHFNGPRHEGPITVRLHAANGEVIAESTDEYGVSAPYASRLVSLDQVFELDSLIEAGEDHFVSVERADDDCFPRMVAGNLHGGDGLLEVTHTFYWVVRDDDLLARTAPGEPEILTFMPLMRPPGLDLELVLFPTNAPGEAVLRERLAAEGEALSPSGRVLRYVTGGDGARLFRQAMPPGACFASYEGLDDGVQARLNAAYRYSVPDAPRRLSTDIAFGAHAHVYPKKSSHWGHGVLSDDWETVVMLRHLPHAGGVDVAHAELVVLDGAGAEVRRPVTVGRERAAFIPLRELIGGGPDPRFVSWFLRSSNCTDLEALWVSYAPHGGVCGEHAF